MLAGLKPPVQFQAPLALENGAELGKRLRIAARSPTIASRILAQMRTAFLSISYSTFVAEEEGFERLRVVVQKTAREPASLSPTQAKMFPPVV